MPMEPVLVGVGPIFLRGAAHHQMMGDGLVGRAHRTNARVTVAADGVQAQGAQLKNSGANLTGNRCWSADVSDAVAE